MKERKMMRIRISLPNGIRRMPRQNIPLFSFSGRKVFLSAAPHTEKDTENGAGRCARARILAFVRAASMTVEAAFALPLFFLAVVSLICMMDLYGTYAERVVKLQEQAETAGAWASVGGEHALPVVDLPNGFTYQPQWYPEALPSVRIAVRGRVHTWSGRDPSETDGTAGESEQDELVYVTEYESVYHTTSECTHLSLSIQAVGGGMVGQLRNQDGKKYHACDKCVGSGSMNGTVYITREGTCYHNDAECSGLTRSVRLVKKSEVEDLRICSRCEQIEAKNGSTESPVPAGSS